jgi:hypothetical protein
MEKARERIDWIKELVRAEAEMEESGMVDFTAGFDPERELQHATHEFMNDLKTGFVESASTFNQLKASAVGRIKVYGISNTQADFMLFRNGFKLVFSVLRPGRVLIKFMHIGSSVIPGAVAGEPTDRDLAGEDVLESRWGAFGDLVWTYRDHEVKLDHLVRYYLTRFIKESAK